jgi:hypothetical protein
MVSVDDEMSPLQIHSPFDEGMHDGQGLFLVGSIVSFVGVHLARGECDRLGSLALVLHEDISYSKVRGIGGDSERKFWVRDAEDRSFGHAFLQVFEGFGGLRCPKEGGILVGEVSEGCGNLGISFDESLVVVAEAEEGLHLLDVGRSGPLLDSFDFLGISGDTLGGDDMT